MKDKVWGPFWLSYGRTRWNEKTVALGTGKGYLGTQQEWYYFIGLCLWAAYINVGIKKGWWKK